MALKADLGMEASSYPKIDKKAIPSLYVVATNAEMFCESSLINSIVTYYKIKRDIQNNGKNSQPSTSPLAII